jgi:hypothetical protein
MLVEEKLGLSKFEFPAHPLARMKAGHLPRWRASELVDLKTKWIATRKRGLPLVGSPLFVVSADAGLFGGLYLADLAVAKRLLISSQLTVFHQAAR